jgi:hypothetical protein
MPAEDDIGLNEKRVYAETREETVAWVASAIGVTRVSVAGTQIGRFSLAERCTAHDLAGSGGRLYVATDEDLLVGTDDGFEASGFGPAVAVGIDDGTPLAAGPDGRIGALDGNTWTERGTVPSDVRGMDGSLVAAADGVYHVDGSVSHAGLDDARDVAAAPALAATGTGLYHRQDGWTQEVGGEASVVAGDGGRAHAVVDGELLERGDENTWTPCDLPVGGEVVDVAYVDAPMAVTGDGTLVVHAAAEPSEGHSQSAATGDTRQAVGDWRHRALGVSDVAALAVD